MYQNYMNLETILSDTYCIQIHKLTTIDYIDTIFMIWHRTPKWPAQDLSPSQLFEIHPRVTYHSTAFPCWKYPDKMDNVFLDNVFSVDTHN
jgi:hypothetical protein